MWWFKQKPAGRSVLIGDIQLYFEIHGEGSPLLLLHGGLSNSTIWKNQIATFAKHHQVIAVDSRGHGRSTLSEQRISYELMASDAVALMDHLRISHSHVLGWSDGGIIGLHLAVGHRERIDRMIIVGANYLPEGVRADINKSAKFRSFGQIAAKDYRRLSPHPERWRMLQANIGELWATQPRFTEAQLGQITAPILILECEREEAIRSDHTKAMARLIPSSESVFVPDAGHFVMQERPKLFNRLVLDYLANRATSPTKDSQASSA